MLLFLIACLGGPSDPSLCDDYEPDDACSSEEVYQDCLDAVDECPRGVVVLESCPVQFACQ